MSQAFASVLPQGRFAGPLVAFASLPSTQDVLRRLAEHGTPEGTVVVTDHQSAGRGRHARRWVAPPGEALLFSTLLRPTVAVGDWPTLTLLAGCAVAEAVEAVAGVPVGLEWPNDVLVADRKLAGILAEAVSGHGGFVVLGIGLNVAQSAGSWPPELLGRAVSLAEVGARPARVALLAAILARLGRGYDRWQREGPEPTRAAWRARCRSGAADGFEARGQARFSGPGRPAARAGVGLPGDR